MARRKSVSLIRDIGVDPRFGSHEVAKFTNILMERGKKNIARGILDDTFTVLTQKIGGDDDRALQLFHKALQNVIPSIEVRPKRVGGSVYQIPTEVPTRRGNSLAMRWLIDAAATRHDKRMGIRIANEILEAAEGRGNAVKKKIDMHKMAEANRAFAHYSW